MADKWYTAASGNWSTAANWNGGTLPQAGDDVYADGKTVTIDQNVNVGTIRTTQRSGGTIGGSFLVSASGFTITCTSSTGLVLTTSTVLTINTTGSCTVNASFNGGTAGGTPCILISAVSSITINGNIVGGSNASNNCPGVSVTAAATVNIVGTITGGTGNGGGTGVLVTAAATINITGNVLGSSSGTSTYGILNSSTASTINVTGNVTAQLWQGIYSTIATVCTVVGTCTSSNTLHAIELTSASSMLTLSTPCINVNNVMAVQAHNIRIYAASTAQWTFQNESGTSKILYSAGVALGNPVAANVRSGITYGASSELTGTLIVANPSNVVSGVPTDNTTGTYATTPALIAAQVRTELAVELARIDATISSRLASAGYTAPNNSDITAIKAITDTLTDVATETTSQAIKTQTDLIPANPASVQNVGAIVSSYSV